MSNGYRPTFFTRERALYLALLLHYCRLISTTRISKNNVSLKNFGGFMEEEEGRVWAAKVLLSWGKGDTHTHSSDRIRRPRPWRSAQPVSKCYRTRPWGEMATPSPSGDTQFRYHPNSGFSASFLMQRKTHPDNRDRRYSCHPCTPS